MKDKLEQLVRDNRQAFDDKEPGANLWNKIANDLHGDKRLYWLWKAAAIIFFATTVGLTTKMVYTSAATSDQKAIANKDFAAVENFYFNMISEKKSMIYDFEEKNINIDQDFEQDMQKLDAMYQVLKEELKNNPSKQVVDALILNLLVRIDILNEQLQKLDTNTEQPTEDKEKEGLNA